MSKYSILVLMLSFAPFFVVHAFDNSSRDKGQVKLVYNTSIDLYYEVEFTHSYTELADISFTPGTTLKFGYFWNLLGIETDIEYMYYVKYDSGSFKRSERRPRLAPSLIFNLSGYKLSYRHRMELRIKETSTSIRQRPRIKLTTPWKWTSASINPYLSDELFFPEEGFKTQEIEIGASGGYKGFGFVLGNIFVLDHPLNFSGCVLILELKYKFDLGGRQ